MTIPMEFLMSASDQSLQNFALARLNAAANLEKEIRAMQAELVNLREAAGVAQWLLDNRQKLLATVGSHLESAKVSSISDAA